MTDGGVLAIDQGTSATKAIVVGPDGEVLSVAQHPVPVRTTGAGGVEQDPERLWESVVSAGRLAVARSGRPPAAVALANQGETVLAWDRTSGRPLSPAISWQDRRAESVCRRLAASGDTVRRLTGLRLDPYFSAPKMTWLRENITTAGVVTTTDTWLLYRLAGAFVTDAATASRSLLLDLDSVAWSPELTDLFGVDGDSLPTIVDCAGVVGETTVFGPPVPVCGAIVDQQAALFAEGAWRPGQVKCTYGTGAFLLGQLGTRPVRSSAGLATCVAWRLGGDTSYCLDGQVYTAGSAVRWLGELGVLADPADIDALVASANPGDRSVFVPALAGLGAPFWNPSARGAFAGLSLGTGRPELVRAVIAGVAASVAVLVRAAADDLGTPLDSLRVDGGMTRSGALLQMQADLAQLPIEVHADPHLTARGAAAFGLLGLRADRGAGGWQDVPLPPPVATIRPAMDPGQAAEILRSWHRAARAVLELAGEAPAEADTREVVT